MQGKIYLVATPIGNLEDITFRALRILKEVDFIAAEDTRQTIKLLNHFEISKKMISYHRHNEDYKTEELIKQVKEGSSVAIVTDAGTPAISDPGELIVKEAIKEGIEIVPIPGACAFVNALIASGMDTNEFSFYGFLPMHKKLRRNKLDELIREKKTIILYEAPHKLRNTLQDLYNTLGDRYCVLAKELTKMHETFIRDNLVNLLENLKEPKGEYIILIEGNSEEGQMPWENYTIEEHYKFYEEQGVDKKEIIKKIAKDRNMAKNDIYMQVLDK